MDITSRKYKFIEQFMKIVSAEKLERFEQLLRTESSSDHDVVAHTINGQPLSKQQFVQQVKNADADVSAGRYTTVEDLEKEVRNW